MPATISVSITLLSLTGGMFLLAKTAKDNLSLLYKIAAWFIIIVSILTLGCSTLMCMAKMYRSHFHYEMMIRGQIDKKMHKNFMKEDMWRHHEFEESAYENRGCCEKEACSNSSCMDDDDNSGSELSKKCYEQVRDSCCKSNSSLPKNKFKTNNDKKN